jgi:choline dehydrogenase
VTSKRWLSNHWEPFLESAASAGVPRIADCNGAQQDGGVLVQTTIRRGRRHSAADAFLAPARKRPNLTVKTKAHVRRIELEGDRAVGVEYGAGDAPKSVRAEREVILAAGAYASPQLLMLSGIGPADDLREHGIDVRVDQPNVGAHLQEHPMALMNFRCKSDDTLDDAASPQYVLPWLIAGRGKLSSNLAEAALHWRSDPSLAAPDFQIVFGPVYYWEHGFRKTGAPALTIGPVYIGPSSRGRVTLRSADPEDHPRVLNNMLRSEHEVDAMLRAIELGREIASSAPFSKHIDEELNPSSMLRTKDELTAWLRATCEHEYHPACTCRIGSADDGVVDPELRVHGIEALRIGDASVMPTVTSGNTQAPTVMIAERCSEFVAASRQGP